MKTKAINNYSVSGSRSRLNHEQRKAAKAFRDSRKAARGNMWQAVKEA